MTDTTHLPDASASVDFSEHCPQGARAVWWRDSGLLTIDSPDGFYETTAHDRAEAERIVLYFDFDAWDDMSGLYDLEPWDRGN